MRHLIALLSALALVGCATGPVSLPVENLAASAQTPVEDLRPKEEGTREIFSLMITSDQYGYTRMAQDVSEPTGPRLFAHRLQEKYAAAPVPATKLHHFAVYLNNRAELKRSVLGGAMGGIIGAAIAGSNHQARRRHRPTMIDAQTFAAMSGDNEYKRALYNRRRTQGRCFRTRGLH
jgi:hypothetical protein